MTKERLSAFVIHVVLAIFAFLRSAEIPPRTSNTNEHGQRSSRCPLTIDPPFEMVRCQTNLEGTFWTGPAGN